MPAKVRVESESSLSRVTTSVTEDGATRHLENRSFGERLKRQPATEIVLLTTKVELFPEDTPVSTQAVREYLSLVWEQYKNSHRKLKTMLLDEVCLNLKIHRKAAIRALNGTKAPRSSQG